MVDQLPNLGREKEMLEAMGMSSIDDLFADIPEAVRMKGELPLRGPQSEEEIIGDARRILGANVALGDRVNFLGAGLNRNYVPASVFQLIGRGEFLTSYTPYQPEVSQGMLQAMWEFQTLISELVGLEVANLSVYDGSTAAVATVGTDTDFLTGDLLRDGVAEMQKNNVRPMMGGAYVAVISPYQAQQLKSDASDTGWRYTVAYNEGAAGNSIFTGEIGMYEGVRIIVNNHITSQGGGYLMGAEALAKAYSTAPGFGPNPKTVVAPVVDKLRRFASVGWYQLCGYSIFRPEALIHISTQTALV